MKAKIFWKYRKIHLAQKVNLGFSVFNMYRTFFSYFVLLSWETDSGSQTWLVLELVKHLPSQGQKSQKLKKTNKKMSLSHGKS